MTAKTMMLGNLEKDVGTSIALLDRLPARRTPAMDRYAGAGELPV